MNSLFMIGSPVSFKSVRKVTFREINEAVLVGTRTESAINPTFFISGIISSKAMAAPVDVGMILLNTDRFRRRSLLPALGAASSIFWLLVAACTVDMDAVMILEVSLVSSKGLII